VLFGLYRDDCKRRTVMTKLSLIGVTAVATYAALVAPSYAQNRLSHVANSYARAGTCAGYDAGNPYNKETDYMAWSAWRARGGWDDRNDFKCVPIHMNRNQF
jgi:hypothetical protein